MKKVVLTYGLLSGALAALLMVATGLYIRNTGGCDNMEIFGYAGMLLSMVFIFLGVRSYRENVADGKLAFGKAFQVGLMITLISAVCYVISWLFVYYNLVPNFMEIFSNHTIAKLRESGASEEAIAKQMEQMEYFKSLYSSPWTIAAVTFLEPLPIGLLVTLVSAFILRRK